MAKSNSYAWHGENALRAAGLSAWQQEFDIYRDEMYAEDMANLKEEEIDMAWSQHHSLDQR